MSVRWPEQRTQDGSWTLVNPELGESCHSTSGAWLEAVERYARPCALSEPRAQALRLLDVGTGLGLNLAAALACLGPDGAPLDVLALELDAGVIRQGIELYRRHADARAGAQPWEPWHAQVRDALEAALEQPGRAVALGPRGSLELHLGDARSTLPLARPAGPTFDAVFLDGFSPRRSAALWEPDFLGAIAERMTASGILSTYCAAFGVRLALARTGLRLGCGPRVGAKREGTLASPGRSLPELPARVARRLRRRLEAPLGHPPGAPGAQ